MCIVDSVFDVVVVSRGGIDGVIIAVEGGGVAVCGGDVFDRVGLGVVYNHRTATNNATIHFFSVGTWLLRPLLSAVGGGVVENSMVVGGCVLVAVFLDVGRG